MAREASGMMDKRQMEPKVLLGGLGKETFGSYQQVFATRLNEFYKTLPSKTTGTFLNISN